MGSAKEHYSSKEEGRAGFEEKMNKETLPPAKYRTIEVGSGSSSVLRQEAAGRAWDKLSATNDEFDREVIDAAFEEVKDDPHFEGYIAEDFGSTHEMFDELVMIRGV